MKRQGQSPSTTKGSLVRFQMDITPEMLQEIEHLQHLLGLATKKELLNNALVLLRWAATQRQKGATIVAANEDGDILREVMLPCLEQARLASVRDEMESQSIPSSKKNLSLAKALDRSDSSEKQSSVLAAVQ
jgi:hypothetical protein